MVPFSSRLAMRQLQYKGVGLLAPFAGVCVAVILVFIQLGFKNALIGSVLNFDRALDADIVITGRQFETIGYSPPWFARSVIYQAQGVDGVESALPLYVFMAQLRANDAGQLLAARFIAFDPVNQILRIPGLDEHRTHLKLPFTALLDARSRNQLTGLVTAVGEGKRPRLYIQDPVAPVAAHVDILGSYSLGPDFTFPGSLIISDLNLYRMFRQPLDRVSLGLVRLKAGADPAQVRDALAARLGDEVQIRLRADFIAAEEAYFTYRTPVGIVTSLGLFVGLLIGMVFIVEVLHNVIDRNLSEYAVLNAMGYGIRFCLALVVQLAAVVAVTAFSASLLITAVLYRVMEEATLLTFALRWHMTLAVFVATVVMSMFAAGIALRRLLRSNPIDLFR